MSKPTFSRRTQELFSVALMTTTPLFAGGPKTRHVDRHTPIRVPSIRGQLRFWWRALFAHPWDTKELAENEAKLWGSIAQFGDANPRRSRVDLWVTGHRDARVDDSEIEPNSLEGYVLWPARAQQGKPTGERRKPGVQFTLHVAAPDEHKEQLRDTVRAWILFGGIGGRTRRGCGSLTVTGDADRWLPAEASKAELDRLFANSPWCTGHPRDPATQTASLVGATLWAGGSSRKAQTHAGEAWRSAIGWLKNFREIPKKAPRNEHWPEADFAKDFADGASWPRAGLGLPLISDKPPYELIWYDADQKPRDRLASPLIIKPMPLKQKRFAPIALWLYRAYPQGRVGLRGELGSQADFDDFRALKDKRGHLGNADSVAEAFANWLDKREKNVRCVVPGAVRGGRS